MGPYVQTPLCTYLTHRFGRIETQPRAPGPTTKNHQDRCTKEVERLLGTEISTAALEQLAANDARKASELVRVIMDIDSPAMPAEEFSSRECLSTSRKNLKTKSGRWNTSSPTNSPKKSKKPLPWVISARMPSITWPSSARNW